MPRRSDGERDQRDDDERARRRRYGVPPAKQRRQ
jgi:hypothetical protein